MLNILRHWENWLNTEIGEELTVLMVQKNRKLYELFMDMWKDMASVENVIAIWHKAKHNFQMIQKAYNSVFILKLRNFCTHTHTYTHSHTT